MIAVGRRAKCESVCESLVVVSSNHHTALEDDSANIGGTTETVCVHADSTLFACETLRASNGRRLD